MGHRKPLGRRDRRDGCRTANRAPAFMEALEPRLLLNADWTVLVYLDGDNNLEEAGVADLNEMEIVGSSADVNILVQFDRIGGYDTSNGNWTDTRRGLVVQDSSTSTIGSTLTSIGEQNMGDPDVLTGFLEWGIANYAADHYMLILWDHGGGIDGVCWDDTSGDDHLTLPELSQAFGDVGQHLDVIAFDACLMGMVETAYELAGLGDVMVGSEQTIPFDGYAYDAFLDDLVADPGITADEIATVMVTEYGIAYGGAETLSAVDLAVVSDAAPNGVVATLNEFVSLVMTDATTGDYSRLQSARNGAPYFTDGEFRDLGAFLEMAAGDTWLSAGIRAAAQTALDAYESSIIANHSSALEGGTGMSIYFQHAGDSPSSSYLGQGLSMLEETEWDTFLSWWRQGPPPEPPVEIHGAVWSDANSDGVWDPGEDGLSDWTVYLDTNNNGQFDQADAQTYASTDVPVTINDWETATSTIVVSQEIGLVMDVNVTLNITHTWDSDLDVYVISPSGQRVLLFSAVGGSGDNFYNTTLDDEAGSSITSGSAPFRGTYRPQGSLSDFDGDGATGTWTLEISDWGPEDTGRLNSWSLRITAGEPSATTDADGEYAFVRLSAGSYVVREQLEAAWLLTYPTEGYHLVTLAGGASATDVNFGNRDARPWAVDGAATAEEDSPGAAIALEGHDEQTADGDLHFAVRSLPSHGQILSIVGNVVTYVPDADFNGTDSFQFVVIDAGNPDGSGTNVGTSDPGTVTITVDPVNDAPEADDQVVVGWQDESVVATLTGSDLETDSGDLTFAISRQPDHGNVVLDGDQATYTPEAGHQGLDTFEFTVTDNGEPAGSHANPSDLTSAAGTVSVAIARQRALVDGQLTLTDDDGSEVEFIVRGNGGGFVYELMGMPVEVPYDIARILLTGTDSSTRLSIRSQGVSVRDIIVDGGSLGVIDGRNVDLVGDVEILDGTLRQVTLRNLTDASITVGAPETDRDTLRAQFQDVAGLAFTSDTPVRSLSAIEWVAGAGGAGAMTAPSIARLNTTGRLANARSGLAASDGDFLADLILTGAGVPVGQTVLGTAQFRGGVRGSDWDITGPVGTINVGADLADSVLVLNHDPGSPVLGLSRLGVGNSVTGSRILSTGNVGTVTAVGMLQSDLYAGVLEGVTGLPDPDADIFTPAVGGNAAIRNVQIRGLSERGFYADSFVDSNIAAYELGTVRICDAATDGYDPFGVAACVAQRIAYVDRNHSFRSWSWPAPKGKVANEEEPITVRLGIHGVDCFLASEQTKRDCLGDGGSICTDIEGLYSRAIGDRLYIGVATSGAVGDYRCADELHVQVGIDTLHGPGPFLDPTDCEADFYVDYDYGTGEATLYWRWHSYTWEPSDWIMQGVGLSMEAETIEGGVLISVPLWLLGGYDFVKACDATLYNDRGFVLDAC